MKCKEYHFCLGGGIYGKPFGTLKNDDVCTGMYRQKTTSKTTLKNHFPLPKLIIKFDPVGLLLIIFETPFENNNMYEVAFYKLIFLGNNM